MVKGVMHGEGGMQDDGGMCGDGGMHGKGGHAWQRGAMHGKGACRQERWPLKQAVCILLEYFPPLRYLFTFRGVKL